MEAQVSIDPELAAKVKRVAQARGQSVPEFVQETLESAVAASATTDPLFDDAVHTDDGSKDLSSAHDQYLYGDAS